MSRTNAFATIRRARSLRERHPDAPTSVVLVALVMATYADGRTGTMIRPGLETVAELTGLNRRTVGEAVRWLEARGELRRDKQGHRGSAACFTYLDVAASSAPDASSSPPEPKCAHCGGDLGYSSSGEGGSLCLTCFRIPARERR